MKKRKSDAKVFFLFLGIALTLLMIGVILQQSTSQRVGVNEAPPTDVIDPVHAIPSDAEKPAVTSVEPSAEPTYLYAYERNGGVEVALVAWDRREGEYVLTTTLSANELGMAGMVRPRITVERPGWGNEPLLVVSASGGAYMDVAVLLVREGDALRLLRLRDEDGAIRPAMFPSGASARNFAEFHLEDVSGDGIDEVLASEGTMEESGDGAMLREAETRVFAWDGSLLSYDERLSWAFSLSDDLFPDPADEAASDAR